VSPGVVVTGGTDSQHYQSLTQQGTFRFVPYGITQADLSRVHGTNERISLEAFQRALCVYKEGVRYFGNYTISSGSKVGSSSSSSSSNGGSDTSEEEKGGGRAAAGAGGVIGRRSVSGVLEDGEAVAAA
jgi:hypothetical protein